MKAFIGFYGVVAILDQQLSRLGVDGWYLPPLVELFAAVGGALGGTLALRMRRGLPLDGSRAV